MQMLQTILFILLLLLNEKAIENDNTNDNNETIQNEKCET